jgi:hypothetical protein
MPYPLIVLPFLKVDGMALYPFILLRNKAYKDNELLIRHEAIHLRQQLEMLILPFYLCYLTNYFINRLKYDHESAYLKIIFEREAYTEEGNPAYLKQRQAWAWTRY